MDKETKLRSILFFVIGFLLVLSLIICIYIVAGERDLVPVEGVVSTIAKDSGSTGNNTATIKYTVDGKEYTFSLSTKKDYKAGDKINVYYHSNNKDQVKYYKTSKLIFLCPLIGLVLCGLGLFELFRKTDDADEFKTSVIGVIGNTKQLKIVTDNTQAEEYVPTPEEEKEVEVKQISKPEEEVPVQEAVPVQEVQEEIPEPIEMPAVAEPVQEPIPEPALVAPEVEAVPEPVAVQEEQPAPAPAPEVQPEMVSADETTSLEDNIVQKMKEKRGDKIEVTEDELKEAIKDVLADVIKEAKQESKPKEVVQVRVIPNYYYISGTSLMYEEAGKEQKELSLKNIKGVTRTINSEGNVVKLTVESDEVKCILTNMKNIDLEQLSNLLRNKLRTMDENFEEVIEHKEY